MKFDDRPTTRKAKFWWGLGVIVFIVLCASAYELVK